MDIQQLANPFGWDWGWIWHVAVGAGLGTAAVHGAITLPPRADEETGQGKEAWDIACALRKAYGLQPAEIVNDYHDALQKVHRASAEQREEGAAKQAEFPSELLAGERGFPDYNDCACRHDALGLLAPDHAAASLMDRS